MRIFLEQTFNGLNVYIYERDAKGALTAKVLPVELQVQSVSPDSGEGMEPTFRFSPRMGDEFLKAMAEALDELNVKRPADSYQQGKLEAMQENLNDLRALLGIRRDGAPIAVGAEVSLMNAMAKSGAQPSPKLPVGGILSEDAGREIRV